MNLCGWLLQLAGENLAVSAFVGALWSFIVDMFPQFVDMSYAAKRWIVFGLCLGVPVLALVVAAYGLSCVGAVLTVETIAQALAAGCAAFAGSQIADLRGR